MRRALDKYFIIILFIILIALSVLITRCLPLSSVEINFVGALLGGVISGALTLIGVKATLENQKNEKFIDLYPKRKMILDEQLDKMDDIIKLYKERYSGLRYGTYQGNFEKLKENFYECVRNSIIVNAKVYDVTKKFLFHFERINKCMGSIIKEFDEFSETPMSPLMTCINAGKEDEFNEHLKQLEKCYLEIESKMNNFDNKYKKLTGI